jgi:plastocyanin
MGAIGFVSQQRSVLFGWLLMASLPVSASAELLINVQNADGEPVANAVVEVLASAPGQRVGAEPVLGVMDQINKEFVGPVLAVPVGSSVEFPNSDDVHHHVYSFSNAKRFELPLYTGRPASPVVFDVPGVVTLGCNIHDWMVGYVYVASSRFFAVTDSNGQARISELPAGDHQLLLWHSSLPPNQELQPRSLSIGAEPETISLTLDARPLRTIRRSPLPGVRVY